tara:strand:+ start:3774 stop:3980 length:207 start_codon:yes stop_codon:yes gene_type:complete
MTDDRGEMRIRFMRRTLKNIIIKTETAVSYAAIITVIYGASIYYTYKALKCDKMYRDMDDALRKGLWR